MESKNSVLSPALRRGPQSPDLLHAHPDTPLTASRRPARASPPDGIALPAPVTLPQVARRTDARHLLGLSRRSPAPRTVTVSRAFAGTLQREIRGREGC